MLMMMTMWTSFWYGCTVTVFLSDLSPLWYCQCSSVSAWQPAKETLGRPSDNVKIWSEVGFSVFKFWHQIFQNYQNSEADCLIAMMMSGWFDPTRLWDNRGGGYPGGYQGNDVDNLFIWSWQSLWCDKDDENLGGCQMCCSVCLNNQNLAEPKVCAENITHLHLIGNQIHDFARKTEGPQH